MPVFALKYAIPASAAGAARARGTRGAVSAGEWRIGFAEYGTDLALCLICVVSRYRGKENEGDRARY
jgi:hypothetical protein